MEEQEFQEKVQELENRIHELTFLCEEYKNQLGEAIGRSAYLNKELTKAQQYVEGLAKQNEALQAELIKIQNEQPHPQHTDDLSDLEQSLT